MLRRFVLIVIALLATPLAASAQAPDSRGEVRTDRPEYRGEKAAASIPNGQHVRNEGGSDGAGLCVISSILANGMFQGVPGLDTPGPGTSNVKGQTQRIPNAPGKGSELWKAARRQPGGYHPTKLEQLLRRVMPSEKYTSYYGPDANVLDTWSKQGYPIGATMNTGANYNYSRIAHMISLIHFRAGGWACVLDNNFPGTFSWMPDKEFLRRWKDNGNGWGFIWKRLPARPRLPDLPRLPNLNDITGLAIVGLLLLTTLFMVATSLFLLLAAGRMTRRRGARR